MADHDSDMPQRPTPDPHTRPEAQGEVRPDQQEELGPIEGLVHASAVEVSSEVVGDDDASAEAERLGVEGEGVEAAQIFSIMVATAVTLGLAVFGVFFLVADFSDEQRVQRDAVDLYPELREVERVEAEMENYSRTDSLYRLPIGEAMVQVSEAYYAQQQGGEFEPAPENFSTLYLDAAREDQMAASRSDSAMTMPSDSVMLIEPVPAPGVEPEEATDADAEPEVDESGTDEPENR